MDRPFTDVVPRTVWSNFKSNNQLNQTGIVAFSVHVGSSMFNNVYEMCVRMRFAKCLDTDISGH